MTICICSSLRFRTAIEAVSHALEALSLAHRVPMMDLPKDQETPEMIPTFVREHFRKIDASDAILVVNPGGYIGNSVKVEIGYAQGAGKRVYFLEKTQVPELDCLAHDFIAMENLELLRDLS